mgnify:CR=1 FL=1
MCWRLHTDAARHMSVITIAFILIVIDSTIQMLLHFCLREFPEFLDQFKCGDVMTSAFFYCGKIQRWSGKHKVCQFVDIFTFTPAQISRSGQSLGKVEQCTNVHKTKKKKKNSANSSSKRNSHHCESHKIVQKKVFQHCGMKSWYLHQEYQDTQPQSSMNGQDTQPQSSMNGQDTQPQSSMNGHQDTSAPILHEPGTVGLDSKITWGVFAEDLNVQLHCRFTYLVNNISYKRDGVDGISQIQPCLISHLYIAYDMVHWII